MKRLWKMVGVAHANQVIQLRIQILSYIFPGLPIATALGSAFTILEAVDETLVFTVLVMIVSFG
jgi:hypothetical protein